MWIVVPGSGPCTRAGSRSACQCRPRPVTGARWNGRFEQDRSCGALVTASSTAETSAAPFGLAGVPTQTTRSRPRQRLGSGDAARSRTSQETILAWSEKSRSTRWPTLAATDEADSLAYTSPCPDRRDPWPPGAIIGGDSEPSRGLVDRGRRGGYRWSLMTADPDTRGDRLQRLAVEVGDSFDTTPRRRR
jgi:hypothetical protein